MPRSNRREGETDGDRYSEKYICERSDLESLQGLCVRLHLLWALASRAQSKRQKHLCDKVLSLHAPLP